MPRAILAGLAVYVLVVALVAAALWQRVPPGPAWSMPERWETRRS